MQKISTGTGTPFTHASTLRRFQLAAPVRSERMKAGNIDRVTLEPRAIKILAGMKG